jgi:PD-(D/E)XK nuclease superfamily protein
LVPECLCRELQEARVAHARQVSLPVHKAQLLTYLRLSNHSIGLLINFNSVVLKNGLHRLVL